MVLAVSRWPFNAETQVQYHASPCGICGKQRSTRAGFSTNTSVFPVVFIPPSVAYSFIHLPPMLYITFSTDSIIK